MAYKAGGNFQKRGWSGGSRKGHPTTAADVLGTAELLCPGNGCKSMGDAADFRDEQQKVEA